VGLILMGWHGQLTTQRVSGSVVKDVVQHAKCDVAVLRDRGAGKRDIRRVLVPIGAGPHCRLALRLAWDITRAEGGTLTALRILPEDGAVNMEMEMDVLCQLVEDVLGEIPQEIVLDLKRGSSITESILAESAQAESDLIVIGASEEWFLKTLLLGSIPDRIANRARTGVGLLAAEDDEEGWISLREAELVAVSQPRIRCSVDEAGLSGGW
jgi:nucleotide-binding universal stress UspA family protein